LRELLALRQVPFLQQVGQKEEIPQYVIIAGRLGSGGVLLPSSASKIANNTGAGAISPETIQRAHILRILNRAPIALGALTITGKDYAGNDVVLNIPLTAAGVFEVDIYLEDVSFTMVQAGSADYVNILGTW
tara:strand:+ start:855 stop:1250 length:396 start_codon:yes stop_codon:yes gene_type:complete